MLHLRCLLIFLFYHSFSLIETEKILVYNDTSANRERIYPKQEVFIMVIDFHTHIFPDKVAEKAVPKLASVISHTPSMNGTAAGLLDPMEKLSLIHISLPFSSCLWKFCCLHSFSFHCVADIFSPL